MFKGDGMRIVFLMMVFVGCVFGGNFKIYTNTRTQIDMNTGHAESWTDSTEFIIRNGRFTHVTKDITSTYIQQDDIVTSTINGATLQSVVVRSEVGNYYYYIFDLQNNKILAYCPATGLMSEFDIYTTVNE